jgi:AcrR family transcriptional regulator
MNVSGSSDPRAAQKQRTRKALVDAASQLLREGRTPTVIEAAEAASVSRATAYRYFPTQEALLIEIADVTPATAAVEQLVAANRGEPPAERLRQVVDAFNRVGLEQEAQLRHSLRIYLDTWFEHHSDADEMPEVREGRRMRWLDDILAPLRDELTGLQWRRLRGALALTIGVESLVVMKDVCRIEDDDEMRDVLQWTASTLLRAATEGP